MGLNLKSHDTHRFNKPKNVTIFLNFVHLLKPLFFVNFKSDPLPVTNILIMLGGSPTFIICDPLFFSPYKTLTLTND